MIRSIFVVVVIVALLADFADSDSLFFFILSLSLSISFPSFCWYFSTVKLYSKCQHIFRVVVYLYSSYIHTRALAHMKNRQDKTVRSRRKMSFFFFASTDCLFLRHFTYNKMACRISSEQAVMLDRHILQRHAASIPIPYTAWTCPHSR